MVSAIVDFEPVADDGTSSATVEQVRAEAETRAGSPDDMALRAASYYELYTSGGRSFPFAIIAAHGALWARWYLKLADAAARVLAVIDITSVLSRAERIASYDRFVDKFRDINRVVFMETWVTLHLLRLDPDHPYLVDRMPGPLRHAIADAQKLALAGANRLTTTSAVSTRTISGGNRSLSWGRWFRLQSTNFIGNWRVGSVAAPGCGSPTSGSARRSCSGILRMPKNVRKRVWQRSIGQHARAGKRSRPTS